MMAKLSIIRSAYSPLDAAYALAHVACADVDPGCKARLAVLLEAGTVHTLNSGIASFYTILEAIKTLSSRKEVVVPAYTAGSLVVAIQKAGLKPVLCDISPDDYNADAAGILSAISHNTLAVVAVHMFGIPVGGMGTLKNDMPGGVYLIEDCCQAMGARIKDKPVGSFGDIGFFSFNRGKNLPANNGGCIIARNSSCEQAVLGAVNACASPAAAEWAGAFLNTMLLVIGTDPLVYGMGHALAAGFRETAPPQDLSVSTLGHFQSSLCLRGLRKADAMFMARYRIGMALIRGLQGVPGLRLPAIGADYLPVFNRLPILLEDDTKVQPAQSTLWQRGIESSRMYEKPLHHMFDLGYSRDDFPNARFLAKHLLTLPVHPSVQDSHIKIMIDTLRGVL